MVGSTNRWALMHELRGEAELTLDEMVARLSPVDLVIVEGFKRNPHPKLEVWRASVGKPMLQPDDSTIRAVASDGSVKRLPVPVLSIEDVAGVADFILKEI
jgi:molybdopterin-guanine dinucleotide biosynthesis protein MobB